METNRHILACFGVNLEDLPDQRGVRSVPFEPYLRLAEGVECAGVNNLVSKLVGHWRTGRRRAPSATSLEQFEQCTRMILLNLLRAETHSKGLTVGIGTGKGHLQAAKRYYPSCMSVTHFRAAKDQLLDADAMFIEQKGFHFTEHARLTRYALQKCASIKLEPTAPPLGGYEVAPDGETVRLKDDSGRLCDYTDTEQTVSMRLRLDHINSVLASAEVGSTRTPCAHIDFDDDEVPIGQRLYRVFNNGTFKHGGRFYGGWWQSAKRSFRPTITINGESTVEVDYKGLHPTILFLRHGLPVPEDPYALVPGADGDNEIRDFAKKTFLALLNAKSLRTNEPKNFNPEKLGIAKGEFQKQVRDAFSTLPGVFGSGIGVELQREDSDLAERVMLHFVRMGIPILPVHDSFIVERRYGNMLINTMKGTFEQRYGAGIEVSVKEG